MPVATNVWGSPLAILGFDGVTATDCNAAAVTVSVVLPEMPLRAALMVAEPVETPLARPVELTVATDDVSEDHVTSVEISVVVPSEKVPIAVSCLATPFGKLGLAGVTEIDCKVTGDVLPEPPPPPQATSRLNTHTSVTKAE